MVTLSRLIELHTLAYEADSAEWGKLFDLDPSGYRIDPSSEYLAQEARCQDAKTVVERMEAVIFAYQLSTLDDVLTLTRWVHARLNDCCAYFYCEALRAIVARNPLHFVTVMPEFHRALSPPIKLRRRTTATAVRCSIVHPMILTITSCKTNNSDLL